ncbi:ATP-dependent zinc metalloprotease FtsH [bacterium]|nr:ATP-dependent zinc metalloprotease FtsH [bacterium]
MNTRLKVILTVSVVIAAVVLAYYSFGRAGRQALDQSSFYDAVMDGRVREVTMVPDGNGFRIQGTLNSENDSFDGRSSDSFTTYVLAERNLQKTLMSEGVSVKAENPDRGSVLHLLGALVFLLIVGAVVVFFMRGMNQGGGQLLSLRRSRAKLSSQIGKVSFKDVAGVEEAKQELQEIVEFLEDPDKLQKLGGKIPTGVLLVGPPGTGKTLLARAVAGEAGVPFFSVSGSDFVEMFVGIGASRVRDLFEQGRKQAPCIVFVDEIDAVGRRRGTGVGGGHDEREQTLNQLLVELDGFESNDGVIVLAATNRPDVLDPALLRPGRFDRQVMIDPPDVRGREEILKIHARKVPLNRDVELELVARGTPGFSGAELANLVNEAALYAAGQSRETVTRADFEHAKDKGLMGSARPSLVINEEERHAMAYHQAGHALLAHLLPEADPLHKVTILPRGRALGTTQQIATEDRHTSSRPYLLATICGLMGGRVAEELQLKRRSSAAGEDFERATTLARKMVTEWGMSESLGPLAYGKAAAPIFLGNEIAQHRDYSEATAAKIDQEVKKIVQGCYDEARRILEERTEALTRVAEALLEHETLAAEQIGALVRGEALPLTPEMKTDGRERTEATDFLPLVPEPGLGSA